MSSVTCRPTRSSRLVLPYRLNRETARCIYDPNNQARPTRPKLTSMYTHSPDVRCESKSREKNMLRYRCNETGRIIAPGPRMDPAMGEDGLLEIYCCTQATGSPFRTSIPGGKANRPTGSCADQVFSYMSAYAPVPRVMRMARMAKEYNIPPALRLAQ
jgi:hypothetical protein